MFTRPAFPAEAVPADAVEISPLEEAAPVRRPPAWALSNWPVRLKVLAIVLVPLLLATVFGGLRVAGAMANSGSLRLASARADVIPAITKYMSALDVALLASSAGRDVEGAKKNFEERKYELQARLANTDVIPDVRSGVSSLLNGGQALLDKVLDNSISLRDRVTTYAPILLTAEDVIDASVRVDDEKIRAQAQGLSRAVGARGQMTMQEILVTRGADLPEQQLRTAMITLAGTEPSTLFGMSEVLGAGSPDAKMLQQQMVTRMSIMSNAASGLVDNPELLHSIQITDGIAEQVIKDATASVTKSMQSDAAARRGAAIRDTILVLVVIAIALVVVLLVARALVVPLRVLRDGALKVAHTDLEDEIAEVRAGAEPIPEPLAVYTTEEIGQVAHAVDELHTQALLLAGDEARLRLLVNDMFETMSRRSRSLVDQQLLLIDRLERNEEDPERLDSLFRLDHLAARLRRNSVNLLVLAGAQVSGDKREPVSLTTVVQAAVSQVEDYRRVQTMALPDCTLIGAAAGGLIHLLAELMDNALRYSPPTTSVRVSAAPARDGGVLLRVSDAGLGMNDSDRRIANMRLQAGGEVTPDNARHMGLFVVSQLAARHGIRVRLRGPAMSEGGQGTTAEIYLPLEVFGEASVVVRTGRPRGRAPAAAPPVPESDEAVGSPLAVVGHTADQAAEQEPAEQEAAVLEMPNRNGFPGPEPPSEEPVTTLLPRRTPGSSGVAEVPAGEEQPRRRRELPTPWWEKEGASEPGQAPAVAQAQASDTSAFFSARSAAQSTSPGVDDGADAPAALPMRRAAEPPPPPDLDDTDTIYQRMLSEIEGDPNELALHPDLDWKSVWDRGWVLAAHADDKPVETRTDSGLPMRTPGARLVPGAANGADKEAGRHWLAANGTQQPGQPSRHAAAARDPEALRASMSSHFGAVRSARSRAHETNLETTDGE